MERGFKLTVGASIAISKLCPDGDISRIGEILEGKNYADTVQTSSAIIIALSEGYEKSKRYEDSTYKPNPLTMDDILSMPPDDFKELQLEAFKAFRADAKPSVELEKPKK